MAITAQLEAMKAAPAAIENDLRALEDDARTRLADLRNLGRPQPRKWRWES